MTKIRVLYEGDLHTIATHQETGQTLHTDAPKDNQGKGQTFSPTDLLATSLATCIATIMGIYAKNHEIDLRGMQVDIEKEMSREGPRRIAKMTVSIVLPKSIDLEKRNKLEKVAYACPVHNSLHPDTEVLINISYSSI